VLHLWKAGATPLLGMAPEGVGFTTYLAAYVLGFPTNLCMVALITNPPGGGRVSVDFEYPLLLLGIVLNWTLFGVVRGVLRQRRG
jgi:hypothetical protein